LVLTTTYCFYKEIRLEAKEEITKGGARHGTHSISLTNSKSETHVVNQNGCADHSVEEDVEESKDQYVEELFGQLWVVPRLDKARVPAPSIGRGCLVSVRKDLVEARRARVEDCFPVDQK
jgi:hypothetical protein